MIVGSLETNELRTKPGQRARAEEHTESEQISRSKVAGLLRRAAESTLYVPTCRNCSQKDLDAILGGGKKEH